MKFSPTKKNSSGRKAGASSRERCSQGDEVCWALVHESGTPVGEGLMTVGRTLCNSELLIDGWLPWEAVSGHPVMGNVPADAGHHL